MTDALYRSSSIGESLMGALKLLQDDGKISDVLAMRVIQEVSMVMISAESRVLVRASPGLPFACDCPPDPSRSSMPQY